MAHQLRALEKYFEFHICAKEEAFIPFRYELQNWSFSPNVEIHLDKDHNVPTKGKLTFTIKVHSQEFYIVGRVA
ncbi:MAG: hypothetical protein AB8G86_22445 [Saprospiraceae bacterium]